MRNLILIRIIHSQADLGSVAGDLEKAEKYILLQSPILRRDTELQIDRFTIRNIVKLAYIDLQNGNVARGNELLNATLPVAQSLPRLGMFGQGIRDVQIFALLGRKDDALGALRAAVDAGYRGSIPYDNWLLEGDPFLASIRDDSRFADIIRNLESLNAEMQRRVVEAEETGDWSPLLALAGSS